MKEYTATVFEKEKYSLGESPFYDPGLRRYSWVDITEGRLFTMTDGKKSCFRFDQPIGAAVPLPDSEGFILAAADGLYTLKDGKAERFLDLKTIYKPYWRSNDAKLDPRGRLFFGACAQDGHEAEGALFCYDNGQVKCLQPNTRISNGMAWSRDLKTFYFSDSLEYAVFKYDYDPETGDISGRRVLFNIEGGVPDGMCIDSEDNLWVAVWGGSRIEKRSGIDGRKLAEIRVPAKRVSSCNFAGDDKTLFITSSGAGENGEFDGCLFKCDISG